MLLLCGGVGIFAAATAKRGPGYGLHPFEQREKCVLLPYIKSYIFARVLVVHAVYGDTHLGWRFYKVHGVLRFVVRLLMLSFLEMESDRRWLRMQSFL